MLWTCNRTSSSQHPDTINVYIPSTVKYEKGGSWSATRRLQDNCCHGRGLSLHSEKGHWNQSYNTGIYQAPNWANWQQKQKLNSRQAQKGGLLRVASWNNCFRRACFRSPLCLRQLRLTHRNPTYVQKPGRSPQEHQSHLSKLPRNEAAFAAEKTDRKQIKQELTTLRRGF